MTFLNKYYKISPLKGLILFKEVGGIRFVVFWFFLIRPQQKRQKEHAKMVEALTKGDEVLTAGGIAGRVADVGEQYIVVQIASVKEEPVCLTIQRMAVQMVLPKGTIQTF